MRISSFRPTSQPRPGVGWYWSARSVGIQFRVGSCLETRDTPTVPLDTPDITSLLEQLTGEDLASAVDGTFSMTWDQVHEVVRSRAYASSLPLLRLPPMSPLVP